MKTENKKSKIQNPKSAIDWVSSFTWREIRNAIFGTILALAGILATVLTMYASRAGDYRLTNAAAIASLVIVILLLIFVVPPLARSAGAEIAQFDFPIQITTGGLIFLCIIIIVGFAAWNTGNNLLFLVLSVMIAALFVSLLAAQASLRDLVVSARFPDHIFAGEPAPVVVTIQNRKKFLPSFSITVEARGPEDIEDLDKQSWFFRVKYKKRTLAYYTYIPRRAGAEQKVEQNFPERGHELVTGFELSTKFPFGFFRHRRRLPTRNVDIIIFPKTKAVSDELHLLPMNAGRLISSRRGAGHDLHSLRDYQVQDDLRHIDWKATARVRRLIVREFTSEDERRVNVWLDTKMFRDTGEEANQELSESSFKGVIENLLGRKIAENKSKEAKEREEKEEALLKERFEQGVTQSASLIQHFIDERAEVRLILGREAGRYGVGKEHLYESLKRLALTKPDFNNEEKETAKDPKWEDINVALSDGSFSILLTTAIPGTIPAHIWRKSHVIYL